MAVSSALKAPRHESIAFPVAVQVFPAFRRRAPVGMLRDAARAALAVGGGVRGASAKVGRRGGDDETVPALIARYRPRGLAWEYGQQGKALETQAEGDHAYTGILQSLALIGLSCNDFASVWRED